MENSEVIETSGFWIEKGFIAMRFRRSSSRISSLTNNETVSKVQGTITGNGVLSIIPIILWCIALAVLAGIFFYFERWHSSNVSLADFKVFYQAALDVRYNRDPFQPALSAQGLVSQNNALATGSYFVYPLPFAIALVPLTYLPLEVAALIWAALSILSFVLTISLLVQICHKHGWQSLTPLLVICCSMIGIVRNELKLGQSDLILTCLIVSSYFAYIHKRDTLAGVLLALAVIVKPYLGLILLYFIWKRAYRVVVVFLFTSLTCFSIAFVVAGWRVNVEWLQVTHLITSGFHASQVGIVSLYGLLLRLFSDTLSARPWFKLGTWPAVIAALSLGIVVTILVLRAVHRTTLDSETAALEFALWVAGSLLVFPDLEDIHATPAIISLVIIMLSVPWVRVKQYIYVPASIYALIVFLYFMNPLLPSLQWVGDVTPVTGWRILETGAYLVGLLLLFNCTLRLLSARKVEH